jgi:hypothetical protein
VITSDLNFPGTTKEPLKRPEKKSRLLKSVVFLTMKKRRDKRLRLKLQLITGLEAFYER